jgi:hypothetical protein
MSPLSLHQLHQRYQEYYTRHTQGQLSYEQFVKEAHKLQALDPQGNWWTIDPTRGEYLIHRHGQWVASAPPQLEPTGGPTRADLSPSPDIPRPWRGLMRYVSSPLAVGLMSFGAAAFWFLYTSLRSGQEGFDFITPLVIGGLPLVLRVLPGSADRFLAPIFSLTDKIPRPMRTGAAFGLPMVMGLLFAATGSAGYGGLRLSVILSVLGSYALTRRRGSAA